MSELQKCYTNYVSIHRDEAHPREVVYWADAQKRIAELQARIQELGVKLRSRGLNIETLEARIAELEAGRDRWEKLAMRNAEKVAELEAELERTLDYAQEMEKRVAELEAERDQLRGHVEKLKAEWKRQKRLFPDLNKDGWMDLAFDECHTIPLHDIAESIRAGVFPKRLEDTHE